MKTKTRKMLPKILAGSIHVQYVRCGKRHCKCATGDLHGPYLYYFLRIGGRLRKKYLGQSGIERAKATCAARKIEAEAKRRLKAREWDAFDDVRETVRKHQTEINQQRNKPKCETS